MARAVSEIEQEIRALPDVEKERLLRALLEELDGPPDAGAEQAWLDEIQRRSRELEAGVVETVPAEKVFADLRAKLAQRKPASLNLIVRRNERHLQIQR
jgi:putative addiction module component (TIGR02574 family)